MRWQRIARFTIAIFVLVFGAVVFVALRRPTAPAVRGETPRVDPATIVEVGALTHTFNNPDGTPRFRIDAERQLTYADGRTVLKNATLTIPEKDGRTVTARGAEMEVIAPKDSSQPLQTARMTGGATLTSSDGLEVVSEQAIYDERTGVLTIPGDVRFTKGRMAGSGVGATYDQRRDVLWLLDRARITVKPDAAGQGAVEGSAKAVGLARREHYVRMTESAHLVGEGRTLDADELTVQLTPDDRLIQGMALRGNSRISGGGAPGAEGMSARDIDLTYGPDGKTLQHARLVENAVVQMAAAGSPRRVSASTIEIGWAPDGTTVTSLNGSQNVAVDLPAAPDSPARRITAATLTASGPTGLQAVTFAGGVQFTEIKPARRGAPVERDRTARSLRLVLRTQPGFGTLQEADFRGNVHIEDGETTADAARAVHVVAQDSFDLTLSPGDPGPLPTVNDGRVLVTARRVTFTGASRQLKADTDVRSSLQPSRGGAAKPGGGAAGTRVPSMLAQDRPVNVTSTKLDYDGGAGLATYTGQAKLWQDRTQIQADVIVLDDARGNLTARGQVRTVMFFEEPDPAGRKTKVQSTVTAEAMVYEDASRVATYTSGPETRAHLVGSEGDVTADRIQLFLKPGAGELDRAEAEGKVVVKEGIRTGTGHHLTYTPANQTYVMTGTPVEVEERKSPTDCRVSSANTLTFRKDAEAMTMENNRQAPVKFRQCAK